MINERGGSSHPDLEGDALSRRILQTWAQNAVAFADVILQQDPAWGSEHFAFGGSSAVLCGRGLYMNQAFAAGLDGPIADDDWRHFEARCVEVGVAPTVAVCPLTNDAVVPQLQARGYRLESTVAACVRTLDDVPVGNDPAISIEAVPAADIARWQAAAAAGWGHVTAEARRASDAFASAAAVVDAGTMFVAVDANLGTVLGCATMTVRAGCATVGGMSTVPEARRRGVQSALINHRLRLAKDLGCDIAATTADPDGGSERNLVRHGFERSFLIDSHVLHVAD